MMAWNTLQKNIVRGDKMANVSLEIVKFCAEEVERQRAKPIAVYWMADAWMFALGWYNDKTQYAHPKFTWDLIQEFGKKVDPEKNKEGFRTCSVVVVDDEGIRQSFPPHDQVPNLMKQLFPDGSLAFVLQTLKPEEVYKQFQEIHPFRDGNGRTGKIIFNWLNGTLEYPVMPPNFWGIANP